MSPDSEPADCIFCQIVRGDAPAHRVHEDERVLAFMDIFPVSRGHTLIIPKRHSDDLFGADPGDLCAVVELSHVLAGALRRVLDPDGIGVHQLNGSAAGQTVFHYHMHLIPRSHGDELKLHAREPGDPGELAELAGRLGAALELQGHRFGDSLAP